MKHWQCPRREASQRRRLLSRPSSPSPASSSRRRTPLFRAREGRVHEPFFQVESTSILEVPGQLTQHLVEGAVLHPSLKPPMARLVRRILAGQLAPLGARPQHPENAVPQRARRGGGPPRPVLSLRLPLRQERLHQRPLLFSQVHFRSRVTPAVKCRARPEKRPDFGGLPRPIPRSALLDASYISAADVSELLQAHVPGTIAHEGLLLDRESAGYPWQNTNLTSVSHFILAGTVSRCTTLNYCAVNFSFCGARSHAPLSVLGTVFKQREIRGLSCKTGLRIPVLLCFSVRVASELNRTRGVACLIQ